MFRRCYLASILIIAGNGILLSEAKSQLLAYEGFDYAVGNNLNGLNGGSGWSGGWRFRTGFAVTVSSGSLDVPNLMKTGNSVTVQANGNQQPSYSRRLAAPVGLDDTEVFYSFVLQKTGQSGRFGGISLADNAWNGNFPPFNNLFVGGGNNASTYGMGRTGGGIGVDSNLPITADSALLVVRAQYKAGNDRFDLYVNPMLGGNLPATANATLEAFNAPITQQIYLNAAGGWRYDEIRVGRTFGDVAPVPEPSALAAFVIGAVSGTVMLLRRRRKA